MEHLSKYFSQFRKHIKKIFSFKDLYSYYLDKNLEWKKIQLIFSPATPKTLIIWCHSKDTKSKVKYLITK